MFLELAEDNLQQYLTDHSKVMVQFSASWCGNCRIMKPKFKKLAAENEDVVFVMVDAEKYPNSRKLANVDNLPTFAAFEGGSLVDQVQTNKVEGLAELFTKIK